MYMEGQEVSFRDTSAARAKGIGIIHQELSLFPNLTIAQNIYMNHEEEKGHFRGQRRPHRRHAEGASAAPARDGPLTPRWVTCGVGQQQMVEIAPKPGGGRPENPDYG